MTQESVLPYLSREHPSKDGEDESGESKERGSSKEGAGVQTVTW